MNVTARCDLWPCALEYNADLNGAINIAKRFSEQCLENGAAFDTALNSGAVKPCKVDQPPENLPARALPHIENSTYFS